MPANKWEGTEPNIQHIAKEDTLRAHAVCQPGIEAKLSDVEGRDMTAHVYLDEPTCIFCGHFGPNDDPSEWCLNAERRAQCVRILYTAKDLLRACELCIENLVDENCRASFYRDAVARIKTAIAKARGDT